jgi:hypothetical protein
MVSTCNTHATKSEVGGNIAVWKREMLRCGHHAHVISVPPVNTGVATGFLIAIVCTYDGIIHDMRMHPFVPTCLHGTGVACAQCGSAEASDVRGYRHRAGHESVPVHS